MFTPQPFSVGTLPDYEGHCVHFSQFGNPDGIPIIVFHGGPGGQSKAKHAAVFDLAVYHVILFDQRGCGQSKPLGAINANRTEDILFDVERLRKKLAISSWFVSGSSWGSTLALAYAQDHPDCVRGLLLGAVFLADEVGDMWAFQDDAGAARLFPDGWDHLQHGLRSLGISSDKSVASQLLEKITQGTVDEQRKVAALLASWEVNLLSRNIPVQYQRSSEVGEEDIASSTVFLHYQAHQYWLHNRPLLDRLDRIKEIPTIIVHGRYDILCPLATAWKLHKKLPYSRFVALPESHHVIAGDGAIARQYAFQAFLTACGA